MTNEQKELLNFAVTNDMLDMSHMQEQIEAMRRKEILEKHPYSIWHGKDGGWYTYLPEPDGGRRLKKRTSQKAIEDLVVGFWEKMLESPTIEEVFNTLNDRRLETEEISQATHTRNRQIFARHFGEFGSRKIRAVTVDDFVIFLEEQVPKFGLTAKAFANLKGVVSTIIKYAKRQKYIYYTMDDVLAELDISKKSFKKVAKADEDEVFSKEETDLIIRYLMQHPDIWNLGLLLLFGTGLRVGELVALSWDDIRPDAVLIRKTETRYRDEEGKWKYAVKDSPKTEAGVRVVAVPQSFQWIFDAIRRINNDKEFVFVKEDGTRLNTNCIRKRFTRVCDNVGVKRRSPHKIRKTYCTILFENYVDPKMITDQMGHTDIMCSENFYHRSRKSLEEKVETISAIPDFQPKMTLVV